MEALIALAKRAQALNVDALMRALIHDGNFVAFVLDLNTESQLYEKGIDSEGKKLRSAFGRFGEVYAPFTIIQKEATNQPTDRVTLKDEEVFYESFRLVLTSNHDFEITARTQKDDSDLAETWGPILGLTLENLDMVIEYARDFIVIPFIEKNLLNG